MTFPDSLFYVWYVLKNSPRRTPPLKNTDGLVSPSKDSFLETWSMSKTTNSFSSSVVRIPVHSSAFDRKIPVGLKVFPYL